jgi:glutamyl-tRNA reductase
VSVVVVGCHEREASLDVLGRLTVADDELGKALRDLCDSPEISEAVVVSTCLRTEVYAVVDRFHDALADIRAFFASRLEGDDRLCDLDQLLTVAYDEAAAHHLFEVAAGVDSALLGEGEILRQVRRAAERAAAERAAGPVLNGLFRHAVEVGKRVRSETAIARGTTSLAYVAVDVARSLLGDLSDHNALLIGAGEAGAGLATTLAAAEPGLRFTVASRARARADELAATVGGNAIALEEVSQALAEADVLLTATSAPVPVIGVDDLAASRAARPLLVIDAGVPRDVDPAVAGVEGVTLLDLDDLNAYAAQEMATRQAEVPLARAIIDEELGRYRAGILGRSVAPLVATLRERAEALRSAELARVGGRLSEREREVVEEATRRIVAKLLHEPTVQLKESAGSPRGERLAEALRILFDL